ncbi:MAG: hypothetical protein ACYSR6_07310 [Planctomycetota bacterium]|jgi:amino acid permease
MWELIRINKRKSVVLLLAMAICLILLGYIVGFALFGQNGAFIGLIIATAVWLILMMISFSGGDQILLAASRAKRVSSRK